MEKPALVYVTYIRTTPEKLWSAITEPQFARQYWGQHTNVSDWKTGSKWNHIAEEDNNEVYVTGKVVESKPPKRLVLTWADPDDLADESRVTYDIEAMDEMVKLTVTHGEFKANSTMAGKVSQGWPLVIASLKSFLETGKGFKTGCAKPAAEAA